MLLPGLQSAFILMASLAVLFPCSLAQLKLNLHRADL